MRALPLASALLMVLPMAAAQPTLRELVERFDAAQAKVKTLQTPFVLTIRRSLLKTPTLTKGTMYLQGSEFVHFAFSAPDDLVLHLTPKALISYSPAEGRGEMLKIGIIKNANRQFLGLGQKLSYLSDYFAVTFTESKDAGGSYLLNLQPRSLSMKKRMQNLQLWIDRDTYLPKQVNWIERGGDSWFLELGPLQVNQALPATVSGFKVPEGVPLRSEFSFFATRKK
jgi:outer membrane lipoprotein-sorting protein